MLSSKQINLLTHRIIGCAMAVHSELGPGLPEKLYAEGMWLELGNQGLQFEKEVPVQVSYKGRLLGSPLYLDLLIENTVIIEMKAVETLLPLHEAQLVSYLHLARKSVGLLINFHVVELRRGIRRKVLQFPELGV